MVVQNSDPYTYFGRRPIRICEGTGLDTGTLGLTVLRRATVLELPTVLGARSPARPRRWPGTARSRASADVPEATVEAVDDRPFPVQVDGDFIGSFESVRYGVAPGALAVVG